MDHLRKTIMQQLAKRLALCLAWSWAAVGGTECLACPFCSAPSLTLSEQVQHADGVVLARWRSVNRRDKKPAITGEIESAGRTNYEVLEVVRGEKLRVGQTITLEHERTAQPEDLFLLLAERIGDRWDWNKSASISREAFRYLVDAPPPDKEHPDRLQYFLKFLEHADQTISNDAFSELANAPYDEIVRVRSALSRERLREWIANSTTSPARTGVYGLLLGLCGNADDARWLEQWILREPESDEFRLGLDGQIGGYLVLTGDAGLDVIERRLLRGDGIKFSDRYAGMQALRFAWQYGEGHFSKDRLRAAMRALLDDQDLLDLVIADLARWQDWSIQDRLMTIFRDESLGIPSVRRAIVRYLMACSRAKASDDQHAAERVAAAKQNLEIAQAIDPRVYENVQKYFRFEFDATDQPQTSSPTTPPSDAASTMPTIKSPLRKPQEVKTTTTFSNDRERSVITMSWLSRTLAVAAMLVLGLGLTSVGRRAHATSRNLAELRRSGVSVEAVCEWHGARWIASAALANYWPTCVRLSHDGESHERLVDTLRRLQSVPAQTHVVIRNARLTELDCQELLRLPRLTQLALHDTAVSGTWDWLERLRDLRCLSLRGVEVTDAVCEPLSQLNALQHLDLIGSRVTDAGTASLDRLTNLTHLDLRGSSISDHSIPTLSTLPRLEYVDIRATRMTHSNIQHWRRTNPRLEITDLP